jgi:hypothetical protein
MNRFRLLFWRRLDWSRPPQGPVRLTWRGGMPPVGYRLGVWKDEREWTDPFINRREQYGPGFACYWSGVPLGELFTHWAKP